MISNEELYNINELITEAEKKTMSELVPMVVIQSDNYPAAHFRAAIIVSFMFSLGLYFSPLSIINPIYFLWIQVPGLFIGYMLAHLSVIKKALITNQEIEFEVRQRAVEAFFDHHLHVTNGHNGVLIFISLLERRIKIITDKSIQEKIEQKIWDAIVLDFTNDVKKSNLSHALKNTIIASSAVLEKFFPRDDHSKPDNQLKNHLIIEK
jgi:putative membrane protein